MAKYKVIPGGVCAAKGFSASGVHAGFRANPNKLDLAIIKACNIFFSTSLNMLPSAYFPTQSSFFNSKQLRLDTTTPRLSSTTPGLDRRMVFKVTGSVK